MILIGWRFVVLWAFLFWQGGFLFYSAIVVPAAQEVIGHRQQGFITRHVSVSINVAGAVALGCLAVDLWLAPDPRRLRRLALAGTWLVMAALLVALFVLHPILDSMLDPESYGVERGFRFWHRVYLWVLTIQWAASVMHIALMLASWRRWDREPWPG